MDEAALAATVAACQELIEQRFPAESVGAAAVLLADGMILTGTSPDFQNSSVTVCHETEPYCAAFRLDQQILASVCLHRTEDGRFIVLSPCGVCRERLADHGPEVLVAVPQSPQQPTQLQWVRLAEALPHYWLAVFGEDAGSWAL